MPDRVTVRVRDCACPDTPHPDGDEVYLLPTLPLEGGVLAEEQIFEAAGDLSLLKRLWFRTFVTHGATGWNLVDEDGPVPFDADTLLADWALVRPVADKAADLYGESVMAPFLPTPSERSPTGRTRGTTSRTRRQTGSSSG